MHHILHSKQCFAVDVMRSAKGEFFIMKFGFSYQTVNFYKMAQYLIITKTMLRPTFRRTLNPYMMFTTGNALWLQVCMQAGSKLLLLM